MLGMTPTFDIDPADLERRYFERQRRFHPDRFSAKPERERQYSMQHATNLNGAYRTLGDPVGRAEHLLALTGEPARTGEETVRDPEILMRAMEMREALARTGSRPEVDAVLRSARDEAAQCAAELGRAFAAADLPGARRLTLRLTYLQKFIDDARERRVRMAAATRPGRQ